MKVYFKADKNMYFKALLKPFVGMDDQPNGLKVLIKV